MEGTRDWEKEMEERDDIISEHWKYLEGVLSASGKSVEGISEIEYHYKTSAVHFWKHATEYHSL